MASSASGAGAPKQPPVVDPSPAAPAQGLEPSLRVQKGCCGLSPKGVRIAKWSAITLVALAVIGIAVGIGMTGGFKADGLLVGTILPAVGHGFQNFGHWVVQTAVPNVRHFMDSNSLTNGQWLSIIGGLTGASVVGGLGVKFGPSIVRKAKEKYDAMRAERETSAAAAKQAETVAEKKPAAKTEGLGARVKAFFSSCCKDKAKPALSLAPDLGAPPPPPETDGTETLI